MGQLHHGLAWPTNSHAPHTENIRSKDKIACVKLRSLNKVDIDAPQFQLQKSAIDLWIIVCVGECDLIFMSLLNVRTFLVPLAHPMRFLLCTPFACLCNFFRAFSAPFKYFARLLRAFVLFCAPAARKSILEYFIRTFQIFLRVSCAPSDIFARL